MKNFAPAAGESILFQVNPASRKSKVKSMCLMFQYRDLNIFKEEESGDQIQETKLDARKRMLYDAKLAVLSDGRGALPPNTFQFPVDERHYLTRCE